MRLFIAAPIAEAPRNRIGEVVNGLQSAGADCKWVEPGSLHLTLSFLGETVTEKLPILRQILQETADSCNGFNLQLERFGAFPSLNQPRVLWIGFAQGAKPLRGLAETLRGKLVAQGLLPQEEIKRPFSAHLTVGRVRGFKNWDKLHALIKETAVPNIGLRIDRVTLYESLLSGQGPRYTVLNEIPLSKTGEVASEQ